ncbi:ATP-binding protein [Planctobacterium marinum]|uniref:histidine kinase n=1 Tax=Planctobacterium marinum TaxID=1631968 RepID=A0AA48KU70_9ALTE|nr:hypothetical protein MACH26_37900 [Planctobacterium marinum]
MSDMVPKARLERVKSARKEAERLLEEKSLELYKKNQELQALSQQLEEKVLARTAELEKARDEALAASKLKSAFLANMSHEIRTPLTAIIGFAENIQAGILSPLEAETGINNIIGNGRHLLTVLNEVLDISKIESGELTVSNARFSLHQMLDEIDSIYKGFCKDKGLHFDIHLDDNIPLEIASDATRLRQVLMNLLGNAVKFTEQGRISLDVKFDGDLKQLTFIARDTGIGIEQSKLGELFKPFTQADSSITRKFGGTGLGLSISRNLARLMGGDIRVSSTPDRGSEFILTILCEACFYEAELPGDLSDMDNWKPLQGSVLMVEDNEMNQLLISQNLSAMGIEYHIEDNGEEGYQAALAGEYDLVLMDIQMPVMDGKEAINILRAVGYNTPVIALTANVMAEDITEYKRLGFNTWLGKPIDRDKFYRTLAYYLPVKTTSTKTSVADLEDYASLQEKFIASLPTYAAELELAVEQQNAQAAERVLHQLKGLCGNFTLDHLNQLVTLMYDDIRKQGFATIIDKAPLAIELMRHYGKEQNNAKKH